MKDDFFLILFKTHPVATEVNGRVVRSKSLTAEGLVLLTNGGSLIFASLDFSSPPLL